jgi:hypothetical protein
MPASRITAAKKRQFVAALADGGTIEVAARKTGFSARSFFTLRQKDSRFATDVSEAIEAGTDMAEQVLWDIALGRRECKSMAQVTAAFGILRARRPQIWREHYTPSSSDQPGVPNLASFDLSKLSDAELRHLTALVAKAHADRLPEPSRA